MMIKLLGLAIFAGLISVGIQQEAVTEKVGTEAALELGKVGIEEAPDLGKVGIEEVSDLEKVGIEEELGLGKVGIEGQKVPEGAPFMPFPSPIQQQCWTEWFDLDDPSGTGDYELLMYLRRVYPWKICDKPQDIEAKTYSGLTPAAAGDVVVMNKNIGFFCRNRDQWDRKCNDYRVRFSCPQPFCAPEVCWTNWFDRDNPSGSGDWETLSSLQRQYPGKICKEPKYIEAVTVRGNIPAAATGQNFYIFNPTEGFVCRNQGQYCRDYKVRFGCCCD